MNAYKKELIGSVRLWMLHICNGQKQPLAGHRSIYGTVHDHCTYIVCWSIYGTVHDHCMYIVCWSIYGTVHDHCMYIVCWSIYGIVRDHRMYTVCHDSLSTAGETS